MRVTDVGLIERRNRDPVGSASVGGPAMLWWDREAELGRDPARVS